MDFRPKWRMPPGYMYDARFSGGAFVGGTDDHSQLKNRGAANQHPIGAIEGLAEALANKATINGVAVDGDKQASEYNLQNLLVAGANVELVDSGDGTTTISIIGGGGSGELEEDLEVSNPIGRYAIGATIPSGTGFEQIFRGMLSKTYYPSLTDPSVSIAYASSPLLKVGEQVPSQNAVVNFSRGSINPQYTAASPYRSGEATAYSISLTGSDVPFGQSGSGDTFTIPAFTRSSPGNVTLTAAVSYGAGVQPKDSDGEDYGSPLSAGSKNTSKVMEFVLPFYWGKNASIVSTLDGLTEDLSKKGEKERTYSGADNEYLYFAYDSAYGDLTSIKDANNIENLGGFVKSTLIYEGQNYIVYRSVYAITGSPSFKFKF